MTAETAYCYSAIDGLELMRGARNYNRFLTHLVLNHAHGASELVDFGAGTGTFARRLRRRGFAVRCIELDAALRSRLQCRGFPAHARLDELPPASAAYVYTLNVLEHIEDDRAALALLASRLQPGGRLLVYVPAFPCLFSSMDRAVGHWRRYRRGPLIALAASVGLRVESARYADSIGFFATLIYKAFGSRGGAISPVGLRLFDRLAFPLSRLLDRFSGRLFGKNLILIAVRPLSEREAARPAERVSSAEDGAPALPRRREQGRHGQAAARRGGSIGGTVGDRRCDCRAPSRRPGRAVGATPVGSNAAPDRGPGSLL